ncbi:MAG: VWA domain-containing protein [Myxococcaceae bacterium]
MRNLSKNLPVLLLASLSAALVLASCSGGVPCNSNAECGEEGTCLPIGRCAPSCTTSGECGSGETCSAGGGCVPSGGCGADLDCGELRVCDPSGRCVAHCRVTACIEDQRCAPDGHCRSPDEVPAGCGGELFEATRVPANFLIVLDHSGSMMSRAGSQPKWVSAVNAVKSITQKHDGSIRFGLQMFSYSSRTCHPGTEDVAIGPNNASAIASALPSGADGNRTPIAGALKVANGNPALVDPDRSNNVLLVTDGEENCNGRPEDEVGELFAKGIKTYVVGFGDEVDPQRLSEMAVAGGTARAGQTKYYQADDPAALQAALDQVALGAMGCEFKLATTPPDPASLYVYVNGDLQNRDPSKQSGWELNQATNRITLYGATCEKVASHPDSKVSIVYGCPDETLVEDGPDAGTSWPTDGGVTIN